MKRRYAQGFTLVEVMVIVVIIGILAALALPTYRVQMERSRQAEGITNLGIIRGAQLRYQLEDTAGNFAIDSTLLDVDFPTGTYFTYSIVGATSTAVATAVRTTVRNPGYGAYTLTIDNASGTITLAGGSNNPPVP